MKPNKIFDTNISVIAILYFNNCFKTANNAKSRMSNKSNINKKQKKHVARRKSSR